MQIREVHPSESGGGTAGTAGTAGSSGGVHGSGGSKLIQIDPIWDEHATICSYFDRVLKGFETSPCILMLMFNVNVSVQSMFMVLLMFIF